MARNVRGRGRSGGSRLRVRLLPKPAMSCIAEGSPQSNRDEPRDGLTLFPKPAIASIARQHALGWRDPGTLQFKAAGFVEEVLKFVESALISDGQSGNYAFINRFGKRLAFAHATDVQHQHGAQAFFALAAVAIQLGSLPADPHVTQRAGPLS